MKIYLEIIITLVFIYSCTTSHAQWVKLNTDSIHTYSSIYFLNKDTGFVCGVNTIFPNNGIILKTTDGGNSWDTSTVMINWLMDIQFINDSVGFAGGKDAQFVKTTNMGITWEYFSACGFLADFSNLFFLGSDSAFVHGFMGDIRLFTPQNAPYCSVWFNTQTENFFPGTGELNFINYNQGYVTGGYGKFLKTIDRGATWFPVHTDSSIYILGAKMTDQNHAVVVGQNGKYSVTVDGGVIWSFPQSVSNHHLMDVDFYNNQYGFAVGGYGFFSYPSAGPYPVGSIWSTSDGGNSWTLVDSSYSEQSTDIHIVNDSLAFAVGLNGLILRNQSHFSTINNVQENSEAISISLFPNPFSEEINIYFASATSENNITFFDLSGKLIYSDQFTGSNYRMKTSHLSKGVYFIKIISDKGVVTRKLVKVE